MRPKKIDRAVQDILTDARTVVSILVLYCAVHLLVRTLLSPSLSIDEANLYLFGQSFSWVYNFKNPPLPNWMTWIVLSLTDGNRTAMFLLDYAIMAGCLAAHFAAARIVICDTKLAALATFGLMTAFGFGYAAHLNLPHAVFLGSMSAAFIWALARIIETGKPSDYLLLALFTGFGMLTKYLFALVPISFAVAMLFTPVLRARIRWPMLALSSMLASLIFLPYIWMASEQKYSLVALGGDVTHRNGWHGPLEWASQLGRYLNTLFDFIAPFVPLAPLIYWRTLKPLPENAGEPRDRAWLRALNIAMAVSGLSMFAVLGFFGAKAFSLHLIYPVLIQMPLWFFLRVKLAYSGQEGSEAGANRIYTGVVLVLSVAAIVAQIWVYEAHAKSCEICRDYWPMAQYAEVFRRAGFDGGTVIAPTADLAGNLRYVLRDARVVTPGYPVSVFGPPLPGKCLVVWEGDGPLPRETIDYILETYGASTAQGTVQGDAESPLITYPKRRSRMNYILLPEGSCSHPAT